MPPKKVTVDASNVPAQEGESPPAKESSKDLVAIEDHNLPKSIVTRLAKGVLPANTQIQGNAVLAMTKGATVFVNYLASTANEICQREGRKTLNPQDVLRALDEIEFPDFKPRLEAELAKFNDIQADKRNNAKARQKASDTSKGKTPANDGSVDVDEVGGTKTDGERAAKKARIESDAHDKDMDIDDSFAGDREKEREEEEDEDDDVVEDDDEEEDTQNVDREDETEEIEDKEEEDEALDNGDDSD